MTKMRCFYEWNLMYQIALRSTSPVAGSRLGTRGNALFDGHNPLFGVLLSFTHVSELVVGTICLKGKAIASRASDSRVVKIGC